MDFREILVHVKRAEPWAAHVEAAGRLAAASGAHLTGLYTLRELAVLKIVYRGAGPAVEEAARQGYAAAAAAEAKFKDLAGRLGIPHEWQVGEGQAADLLTVAGRLHDLVVVEQTNPATDDIGWDAAEQAVLTTGKPTLVVPYTGVFASVGARPVVAWNGSREAALAVHGALPLLARAERVVVLLGPEKEVFSSITRAPKADIAAYLARHGAKVETRPFAAGDAEAGARILDAAAAARADLLVMGAYGRSWLREWVLGGATRHVLKAMTLPVLMAH